MNGLLTPASWWLLSRARGVGLLLRAVIVLCPMIAMVIVRLAGDRTLVFVEVAIALLAVLCFVIPDSHFGLLVVLLVGVDWMYAVDERATPWSLAVAVLLALFHAALAAATVAPPAARWTRAMCHRWLHRVSVVSAGSAGLWLIVAQLDRTRVPGESALVAVALMVAAITGLTLTASN